MAHSNGRIYIDTSVTPNVGISIADIQQIIGSGRNDIGGLIRSGSVNKWSKIKPLCGGGVDYLVASGTNYRGVDGKCGYAYAQWFSTIVEFANRARTFYDYNLPNESLGDKFRFMDFNGYNHLAEPAYVDTILPGEQFTKRDIQAGFVLNFNQPAGSIMLDELIPNVSVVGNLYPAIVFFPTGQPNSAYVFTSAETLAEHIAYEDAIVVNIPKERQVVNTWYDVVPAVTTMPYVGGAATLSTGDGLFPMPSNEYRQIRILEPQPNWIEISNFTVVYLTSGRYRLRFTAVVSQLSGDPANPYSYYELYTGAHGGSRDTLVYRSLFNPATQEAYGTFNIDVVSDQLSLANAATLYVYLGNADTASIVKTYEDATFVVQE